MGRRRREDGRYARYVLGVLVVVYVFNFLDRQILSILAERIRGDLGLTDAQLGFLHGTTFAVFYAVLGIPLGRLADVWDRRRLMALSLALWSAMTAVSGLVRTFAGLGAARVGVAIGEAGASPAAYSTLSDWFPPRRRATVLAIYSGGVFIGTGLGLLIGGQIVDRWDAAFTDTPPPWGLRGWQVAFLAMGLPGLTFALVVRALHEPVRGQADGEPTPPHPHPFREFARELTSILPPLSFFRLAVTGAGATALLANAGAALAFTGLGLALTRWLADPMQWIALCGGLYVAFSWAQNLRVRDPECFAVLFDTPALRLAVGHFALLSFTSYGLLFWTAPYFVRVLGVRERQLGTVLGLTTVVAGLASVTLGGLLADRWRRRHRAGRLYVSMLAALLPVPIALWMFSTRSVALAYALNVPLTLLAFSWAGSGASTVLDMVPPRMRATASAAYLLTLSLVGLAMGPYVIGRTSVALGSLRAGILWALLANGASFVLAVLAARHLGRDPGSPRRPAGGRTRGFQVPR